jgi:hypothetical protein
MTFDVSADDKKRIAAAEKALSKGSAPDYIYVGAQIEWRDNHYRNQPHGGVWTVRSFTVERRDDRTEGGESVLDLSLEKEIPRGTSTVMTHFNARTMRPFCPEGLAGNSQPAEQQMELEYEKPIINPHKKQLRL